jgi:8-oxo-dGTP pyrophosphatase MutT (NUDIX family)
MTTLPASEYAYRRRDGRLVFKRVDHFLIETPGEAALRPQRGEVDEVAWFPLDEAPQRVAYRDLRAALAAAQAFLSARAV